MPPAPPSPPSARQRTPTAFEPPPSQPPPPGMMPPVLSPSAMPPPGMAPAMGQPQYSQMPPVVAQGGRSNRGVYMVLGSVVTIGVLAAAAFYVPKLFKARASGEPSQVVLQTPRQQTPLQQQVPIQQAPVQQAPMQQAPVQQQEEPKVDLLIVVRRESSPTTQPATTESVPQQIQMKSP